MTRPHLCLPLCALLAWLAACGATSSAPVRQLAVRCEPVTLGAAGEERIGELRFRAGCHLTAATRDFGGFSGLVISADGRWLTALSDRGRWLTAQLVTAPDGTLVGLTAARLGELLDERGKPVREPWYDAEEVTALPGRGYLVTFERKHRGLLYSGPQEAPLAGAPRPFPTPTDVAASEDNEGMEAVTALPDGRLLILSEGLRTGSDQKDLTDDVRGWLGEIAAPTAEASAGAPAVTWHALAWAATDDLVPTGAAALPDGDVVVLERSYEPGRGVDIRLSTVPAAAIAPGARLESRELARLRPPFNVDNMESVEVRPGPAGETLIYLLSDDNQSASQRTLLLQFELAAPAPGE